MSDQQPLFGPVPFSTRLGYALRRYFVTGLITLFPFAVTVYLLIALFRFSDGLLGRYLEVHIPGLGLVLTVLILLCVGFFSTHFVGRVIFPTLESWFNRLPLIRQIYPSVKQLTQFLFGTVDRKPAFRSVVLVEFPRAGCYSLAFVTHEQTTRVLGTPKKFLTLLVPTPPSPFSGPLLFVPEDQVIHLTMSIEDALKLSISGGVVSPELEPVVRSGDFHEAT